MKYIITANGPDKIGLVSKLSNIITSNGGNIEKSRMAKLDGDFAILMLININLSKKKIINKLKINDLHIYIHKSNQNEKYYKKKCIIKVEGADNEGIIYNVTDFLAEKKINIESVKTDVTQAPISGINLFHMKININLTKNFDLKQFQKSLEILSESLDIDLTIE